MITELFYAIDRKDLAAFKSCLSDDCLFRFGNQPQVRGRESIGDIVAGFFNSIQSLRHDLIHSWSIEDGFVCHGMVTYTRYDGTSLSVPFCNLCKFKQSKIGEYLIFVDISRLYREQVQVAS